MRFPGFSAEAALDRFRRPSAGRYQGLQPTGLIPQLMRVDWECVGECREAGGPLDICGFFCTEQEEGGGGEGPPERCRPGCSRLCQWVSDVDEVPRPGYYRFCLTPTCEVVARRCRAPSPTGPRIAQRGTRSIF